MGHPWEGTVHQHTAIRTDHRRRTARTARDSAAITSLGVPCHRGKIPVRPACAVNHYQSCDPQHAMPCSRSPSSAWALMLGPMTTARKLEKQQGPESHGRDIDHIGAEDGTAPKLGRIGTECGTIGGLQSKPGGDIAPPARRIGAMTGNGKTTGIAPSRALLHRMQHAAPSSQPPKMSRGSRAALLCGTKAKLAVTLPPSLFEALREKPHQANQEGAADLLRDFLGRGDFKKFHTSFHTDCSQVPSCGNWTLSFWTHLLTRQMENSTSSEKTYGDAVESFLHYIASEPEWVELYAAKLLDKILHGLYSEMGWQVSFQQLETLLQKYYPRNPAQEEALGGDIPPEEGSDPHRRTRLDPSLLL